MTATMASSSWQDAIALRLADRDARDKAHDQIIADYQQLAKHARTLQSRNQSLLQAAGVVQGGASASTATGQQSAVGPRHSTGTVVKGGQEGSTVQTDPNPVHQAYLLSLESQLSTCRQELNSVYKCQSQSTQRLITLNEELREKEEVKNSQLIELTKLREEKDRLVLRERDLKDNSGEKDRVIELLQDELRMLSLELNQVEGRNDDLKKDNANLVQRWLDRAREEVEKVNEANLFLEEIEKRKQQRQGEEQEGL